MKKHVFILEDDISLSTLLKLKLERAGYRATLFNVGEDAFNFILKDNEGILLADYYLPDLNCMQLINRLQENGVVVPFIVITGVGDNSIVVDMMKKGAADFVVKNIGFADTIPGVVDRVYENILMRKALDQSIESIKQSELKFRFFFEKIQDIFFVLDKDGLILEVSPSIEKILGYPGYKVIGKRINMLFYNQYEFISLYRDLMKQKSVTSRNVKVRDNDNGQKYMSVSCNISHLTESEVKIIGIAQDISKKIIDDAEATKMVLEAEENERRKLSEIIHDDIGPMLSVIKMYFELINNAGDNTEKRQKLLSKISEVIDATIQKTRMLTSNIVSNVLDLYGLKKAIEFFTQNVNTGYSAEITIDIEELKLSRSMEVFLYRASVEMINNTIKHSGASRIYLKIFKTSRNLIFLYIDNGCGFNTEILQTTDSLKGNGMLSILNKVNMMSGDFRITSEIGQGVKVKIIFDNNLI